MAGVKQETDLAVFVYGSLQPGGRNWARYCEGKVVAQQRARVRGKLYRLRDPFPAVLLDDNQWTHGWQLVLRDADALRWFDELENFVATRPPEQNEYQRVRTACFAETENDTGSTSLGEAWIYIMTPERIAAENGVEIPSGIWHEP
jgi:gamma-glutamylcyclotransferase (GGCT)/AIG2-like uncharacterized protein YtfP